jgi:sugar lactone lactonase YvrE
VSGASSLQQSRYAAERPPGLAEGWTLERLTPPSRLFAANGLRTGADGRVYVAQLPGSQISAIDIATGVIETVSPMGSDIVGPDDIAFDSQGGLYATEFTSGRVSMRDRHGQTRVVRGDVPSANGITFHQGRLFIDECRVGGRLMELDLAGGEPRVLLEDIPMPNALEVGPDGMMYLPVMGANEIWRINPEGGAAEKVAGDLGVPDAVKFDPKGFIVSTQVASGEVLRIDPRTGDKTVLASLAPGLDNLTFVGERLFVSHLTDGKITEILKPGETREVLPGGFNGPLDLAVGDDGEIYIADNVAFMGLKPGGEVQLIANLFTPTYPGGARGLFWMGGGCLAMATTGGRVALYWPGEERHEILAEGLDQPYGVAMAANGAAVVVEQGAGRLVSIRSGETEVLATGLQKPTGVVISPEGAPLVSETGAGRIVKVSGGRAETVLDGLKKPQGMVLRGGKLYVLDAGAQALIEYDLESRARRTLATDLPIGAPPGVTPKPLGAMPPFAGPLGPYAGLAAGPNGSFYISADAEGSILALRPA